MEENEGYQEAEEGIEDEIRIIEVEHIEETRLLSQMLLELLTQ
jgi:hypothetical protein